MARTIREIYDAIDLERQNQTELAGLQPAIDDSQTLLNDLSSPSKVAEWRLWQWVVAVAIWVHENLWDLFKKEVENKIASAHYGTPRWFQRIALEFQYGFTQEWTTVNGYEVLKYADTTSPAAVAARIVKYCAVVELGGQVLIKVAKDVGGSPVKLTTAEKDAFDAYISRLEPAGANRVTISDDPDTILMFIRAYYNPEKIDPVGFLIGSNSSVLPMNEAILDYLKKVSFNGVFRLSELHDAIINTGYFSQVTFVTAQFKYGSLPYTDIVDIYIPNAGYATLDPAYFNVLIPDVQN